MHPGQQQGLRILSISSEHVRAIWSFLVSGFLTEVVQQIHSLRASGVMSSHASLASLEEARAFRRSAGNRCAVPPGIRFMSMEESYQILASYGALEKS